MSIRNKEGLSRDIYLAIEHFGDIQEARQYIIEEFKNEYTEAELNATFDEVAKSFQGNDLKGWETMSDTLKRCNECLECHHFCNGCDGDSEPCKAFKYATH